MYVFPCVCVCVWKGPTRVGGCIYHGTISLNTVISGLLIPSRSFSSFSNSETHAVHAQIQVEDAAFSKHSCWRAQGLHSMSEFHSKPAPASSSALQERSCPLRPDPGWRAGTLGTSTGREQRVPTYGPNTPNNHGNEGSGQGVARIALHNVK